MGIHFCVHPVSGHVVMVVVMAGIYGMLTLCHAPF